MIKDIDFFNPSDHLLDTLRTGNVIIGLIACGVLLFVLARRGWKNWNTSTRLGWMSLFLLCFTGTYGTIEVKYFDTYFRVPMVTVALLWALLAALWPLYEKWKLSKEEKNEVT